MGLDKSKTIQTAGFNIKTQNPSRKIKCFGKVPQLKIGDYFEFEGEYENESSFKVDFGLRVDDNIVGATSMMIYLFGPKTAQKLISFYENDSLKCLDTFKNHEDIFYGNLKNISGVGKKTADKAYMKYENHIAVDVLFNKFAKYGLNLNKALKVYNVWGEKAMKRIDENPYNLLNIEGIPFPVMDSIALDHYGFAKTDSRRVEAAVMDIMYRIRLIGHVFIAVNPNPVMPISLVEEMKKMLRIDEANIREAVVKLINEKKLIKERQGFISIVYLPNVYHAEKGVARIIERMMGKNEIDENSIKDFIKKYEENNGFKLAERQKEAIHTSVMNKFSIISGPPGSGKTTIIDVICNIMREKNEKCMIKLAAPTGKAAKRITESTGLKAETVHRMLRYNPKDEQFEFNENNPLDVDLLIVDEFSMMPLMLTYQLLTAIPKNATVIFVGDKAQLPSVQEGKILEDMLEVPFIPKTILDEIYRQKKGSTLLEKALNVAKDRIPSLEDEDDFHFIEEDNVGRIQEQIQDIFFEQLKKYSVDDILLLTPQNKGEIGTDELNMLIQERYNPGMPGKLEMKAGKRVFRTGDRVIQLVNEEEFNVFNGMVGTIVDIVNEDNDLGVKDAIYVDYGDGEISEYTRDRFENIKLAYALTIHKSQGSEAKCVIMVVHEIHSYMLRKKILYTGMTRAKKELIFIGQKKMIEKAILQNKEPIRNTKLKYWLCNHE